MRYGPRSPRPASPLRSPRSPARPGGPWQSPTAIAVRPRCSTSRDAPVSAAEYAAFRDRYQAGLAAATAVVLTGSLPPGLPAGSYAELTRIAAGAGVPTVLDAEGEPLLRAAAWRRGRPWSSRTWPSFPARGRPAGFTGTGGSQACAAVVAAADELRQAGAQAVVVCSVPAGCWRSPATGYGEPRTPVRWPPTRPPARATR